MHDEGPLWERGREERGERDGGGRRGSKRGKNERKGWREIRQEEGKRERMRG